MQLMFDQPENVSSSPSLSFLEATMSSNGMGSDLKPPEYFPIFVPDYYYNHPVSPNSLVSSMDTAKAVPQDAVFLLKHYASAVISLMTPLRHSKTPWHILFIPHTKGCLASLALGDEMSDASLCAYYGT
jgi:arginine metabolism regulation protein II